MAPLEQRGVQFLTVIGFDFIWKCFRSMAPLLKLFSELYLRKSRQSVLDRMESSSSKLSSGSPILYKVFSYTLNPEKTWYALSSKLCCSKPSTFCSSVTATLFPDEYRLVRMDDLFGENGVPASYIWFSHHKTEKVYVATAFGLLLGILRLKTLENCPFIRTQPFLNLITELNSRGFVSNLAQDNDPRSREGHLKNQISALEAQLSSKAKDVEALHARCIEVQLPYTPPPTPSPPKPHQSPPNWESPPDTQKRWKRRRTLAELREDEHLVPIVKKRKIREVAVATIKSINSVCKSERESLGSILGECCLLAGDDHGAREAVISAFDVMTKEKGVKTAFSKLVSEATWNKRIDAMRVPDWVFLLFKLKSRISDSAWQDMTNLTKLGRTGKKSDEPIFLVKNNITALRREVFKVTKALVGLESLGPQVPGYGISLESVALWIIREMHLHGSVPDEITFNLKIDRRPFFGKDQVSIGIVVLDAHHRSVQSAKSVYPLAIANCKEKRKDLKKLFTKLNKEKDHLKKHGISVDGKHYRIRFKVTLDYKGLVLLMVKVGDEDFQLGGQGLSVEFCIFCMALRACDCDLGSHEVCLEHLLQTKANIGGFKGLRDDLVCILDEDLSSMCLCALHCEMRNTEQLLKSVGLLAHEIGSLKECNMKLSTYGPESFKADRISVKLRPGQQTAAGRNNISIASFSGSTERYMLTDIEDIVEESLPNAKLAAHFKDPEAAKMYLLNKITFCETRVQYYNEISKSGIFVRDFGTRLEEIPLTCSDVSKEINQQKEFWREKQCEIETKFRELYKANTVMKACKGRGLGKKRGQVVDYTNDKLSSYTATLTKEFLAKVCSDWKDIALVIRDVDFKEDEEDKIDVFDVKCKEWGFLLLEMFGSSLGTGDYGHLTIEHVPMLFRVHRSLNKLANQGFEASHKLQRQLYARATSHDSTGSTVSSDQILTHLYAEMLLDMRLVFREATSCITSGMPFHYRGCGWKPKRVEWSVGRKNWIYTMDALFTNLFGTDYCEYKYTGKKHCVLVPGQFPLIQFKHSEGSIQFMTSTAVKCKENKITRLSADEGEEKCEQNIRRETKSNEKWEALNHRTSDQKNGIDASESERKSRKASMSKEIIDECLSSLGNLNFSRLTRREKAALKLAKVGHISPENMIIVHGQTAESDPSLVFLRPSENTVQHAMKLLKRATIQNGDYHQNPIKVRVGTLGFFTMESLEYFQNMCSLASEATKVREEQVWLSQTIENTPDNTAVKELLFNSKPQDEVLALGMCIMDVSDFSTLACERYVNGFTIDVTCLKFVEEKKSKVVYLPSYSQTWARQGAHYFSNKVGKFFENCSERDAKCILAPIHYQVPKHWGLICFDTTNKTVYFDDGLKITPPSDILTVAKNMLAGFKALSNSENFQEEKWNHPKLDLPLPRINMPLQTTTGEGSGSCGVGVILSVRDIVTSESCLPSFSWRFEDMSNLRKHLMTLIIKWRNK